MKPTIRNARGPLVIVLALLAAVVIAACGGSGTTKTGTSKNASSTTTTKSNSSSRTALAACLKKHGVTLPSGRGGFRGRAGANGGPPGGGNFNGPPPNGGTTPNGAPPSGANGGGFPGGGGGFGGGNSKFAKAFKACGAKFGSGGFAGGGGFRGRGGTTPKISTASLKSYVSCIRKNGYAAMPEPKATGNGQFFPRSVESNAKFKAANKKCESVLLKAFRSFRPPAGGGTQTTAGSSTDSSA